MHAKNNFKNNDEYSATFRCIPENGDIIYEAHIKGGNWLGAVNSKDYKKNDRSNPNSYAGIYGHTIDGTQMK